MTLNNPPLKALIEMSLLSQAEFVGVSGVLILERLVVSEKDLPRLLDESDPLECQTQGTRLLTGLIACRWS